MNPVGVVPFFIHFATGAMHCPHHVAEEWSERFRGAFDEGWDALRAQIVQRQLELRVDDGVVEVEPYVVRDKLQHVRVVDFGLSGILAELNCGMRIPHGQVVNSLRMMCEQVVPRFRD